MRERRGVLRGIVNGIDAELWNPMNDALIAERYSWSTLERKNGNKAALQRRLNLAEDAAAALPGTACRSTHPKGTGLASAAAAELLDLAAPVCVLGRRAREHATAQL